MTDEAKIYRQGDVWIYCITPGEYREQVTHRLQRPTARVQPDPDKGVILAEGEVTGHHHRIPNAKKVELRLSRSNSEVRFLEVKRGGAELVHEEHETIALPAGHYEVRIQREYAPTERKREVRVYD